MSHSPLSQLEPANLTAESFSAANNLDAILEQAQGHLQLQMLLIEVASCNDQADFDLIARAYHFAHKCHAGQMRKSGRPFLQHCVEVARILAQLRLDTTTVAVGLLHDVLEDTTATFDQVSTQFGDKIATLIDGVTKIDHITFDSREKRQAETYRKMLLFMVEDIRVILIKFADRLHNMRTLEHLAPEQQERTARETIDVYAPLAHRFGLARLRWELEDLGLKYLESEIYGEIRDKIAMKRRERETYIEEFKAPIEDLLKKSDITCEITGRAKNFFSIYNKMKARGKPLEEIYDLLAIRIIVSTPSQCYNTMGLVHSIYQPVPQRIKDYISTPKTNMYQSLHTVVIGLHGRPVEVQIRTQEMHHTAEIGIAAHWRYKGNDISFGNPDQHMPWLRQVVDWQRDATDPTEFMENLKIELFRDEIFAFTPKGDLHQLPRGATPIDFAFAVHTDIGLHCLTARANGQIIGLDTELKSGDTIEIISSPHQKPSPSWLDLVKTTKARHSIRRWLREARYPHNVQLGRELIERQLQRSFDANHDGNIDGITGELGYSDSEHLYAAVGNGDLALERVISKLAPQQPRRRREKSMPKHVVCIQSMDDVSFDFARCCAPIPGDSVMGRITQGRGISVHRTDCPNIIDVASETERLLNIEWNIENEGAFTVRLLIRSRDRKYLLSDITTALSDSDVNICGSTTQTVDDTAEQIFQVSVKNTRQLQDTIARAYQVDGVFEVQRLDSPLPAENGRGLK